MRDMEVARVWIFTLLKLEMTMAIECFKMSFKIQGVLSSRRHMKVKLAPLRLAGANFWSNSLRG